MPSPREAWPSGEATYRQLELPRSVLRALLPHCLPYSKLYRLQGDLRACYTDPRLYVARRAHIETRIDLLGGELKALLPEDDPQACDRFLDWFASLLEVRNALESTAAKDTLNTNRTSTTTTTTTTTSTSSTSNHLKEELNPSQDVTFSPELPGSNNTNNTSASEQSESKLPNGLLVQQPEQQQPQPQHQPQVISTLPLIRRICITPNGNLTYFTQREVIQLDSDEEHDDGDDDKSTLCAAINASNTNTNVINNNNNNNNNSNNSGSIEATLKQQNSTNRSLTEATPSSSISSSSSGGGIDSAPNSTLRSTITYSSLSSSSSSSSSSSTAQTSENLRLRLRLVNHSNCFARIVNREDGSRQSNEPARSSVAGQESAVSEANRTSTATSTLIQNSLISGAARSNQSQLQGGEPTPSTTSGGSLGEVNQLRPLASGPSTASSRRRSTSDANTNTITSTTTTTSSRSSIASVNHAESNLESAPSTRGRKRLARLDLLANRSASQSQSGGDSIEPSTRSRRRRRNSPRAHEDTSSSAAPLHSKESRSSTNATGVNHQSQQGTEAATTPSVRSGSGTIRILPLSSPRHTSSTRLPGDQDQRFPILPLRIRTSDASASGSSSLMGAATVKQEQDIEDDEERSQEVDTSLPHTHGIVNATCEAEMTTEPWPPKTMPIGCNICGEHFGSGRELETHHYASHPHTRPYVCEQEQCGERFRYLATLEYHRAKVHNQTYTPMCGPCNRQFRNERALRAHLAHHTKDIRYRCSECNVKFNSTARLNAHKRGHHAFALSLASEGSMVAARGDASATSTSTTLSTTNTTSTSTSTSTTTATTTTAAFSRMARNFYN